MKRTIISFAATLPFVLLIILLIMPPGAHSSTDRTLLFVGNQDYEPMAYLENGAARGFYVDLAEALSRNIGREINVQLTNWHEAQQMVQDGRADAVISMSITDERKKIYDFSTVVTLFEFALFLREDAMGIRGLSDLEGKTIAVFQGGLPHHLLMSRKNMTLAPAASHADGFRRLKDGSVSAFATDKWVGSYSIQKHGITGITLASEPFAVQESAIAVKKGNAALLADINSGLNQLQKTGELKRLHDKWSGQKIIFTTEEKLRAFLTRAGLGAAAVALLLLAVWIIVLKRQIARRKKAEKETKKSEDDLRLSELRYRELFKRTSKCAVVYQPLEDAGDFIIVDLNEATENAENIKRPDVLDRTVLAVFPQLRQLGVIDALRRVYRTGVAESHPLSIRKDGRIITWCEYYIYKLPSGEIVTLYEYITERKKMEEELRQSEEKYRSIVDNIVEGIYQATPDGKFLSANFAQARLYGYASAAEFIASVTDIPGQLYVHPSERRRFMDLVAKQGQVTDFEFEAYRKDGSKFWVSNNARIIFNTAGNILYYEGTNIDITARKRAEEELAAAYQLNKEIIASVTEGIVIYDRNLRYRMWNPFMERYSGIQEKDLLGKKVGEYHTPLKAFAIDQTLQRILNGETLQFPPFPYDIPQSGKKGWAEVACTQQRNEKNEVIGVIVSIHEVTEKRKMEERLRRAEKMEALGLLAGGVAHDLNNVIGISIGYAEMLQDDLEPDSPLRSHIECIMQATERASAIVQDMLTMARRGVAVSKVINLNTIICDFLEAPEICALQALHPNVDIKTVLSPDLLNISGSPVHLTKTVMNLITNAAESIRDHGVICLSTQNVHLDRPVKGYDSFTEGDYVVLSASDTGDGIPAENLPHIFEPFYTRKVMGRSGTGLGLAVVWGTLKDHNGYIDVASQPGQGTIFSLYFPVVREELTASPEVTDRIAYLGKGEMILVVDDVPEQRELATRLLSKLNYLAASVASGEEAVEFLTKSKADLVVLDMIMDPGIDGLETYRRILEVYPGQKAIIVSGFAETSRVTETQRLGAGAYVKKPYIMETLGTAVRQELDRKK